jgi:hypothetical protein
MHDFPDLQRYSGTAVQRYSGTAVQRSVPEDCFQLLSQMTRAWLGRGLLGGFIFQLGWRGLQKSDQVSVHPDAKVVIRAATYIVAEVIRQGPQINGLRTPRVFTPVSFQTAWTSTQSG